MAFSRDTDEKVYVQHRMLENSRELYAWLQEGAYFYVCGEAQRMATDVHEALVSVVAQESGQTRRSQLMTQRHRFSRKCHSDGEEKLRIAGTRLTDQLSVGPSRAAM